MEPKVEITPALLNDKAFAFLERFARDDVTDTSLLFNVEIKLAVAGITFKLEEWIDLIDIIILNLKGVGINAIKAVWELAQAKVVTVVPLLEDAATWQLVLRWAADDSLSFANFLTEMEKFGDRYQFDEWKSIFDQVFEVSREGTAVEVVRAAMAEHGIVEPSSKSLCRSHRSLHPAKRPRMSKSASRYLDISAQENEEDEEEDELDDEANRCPRVTEIPPSGRANLTQQLESLFRRYGGEGSAEGSRAKAHQQGPVRSVEGRMEVGTNRTQPRVFKVVLPSARSAGFVLQHFKLEGLKCKTFHSVPRHIYVEAPSAQDVRLRLPPSHANLVPQIMPVPMEEMEPFAQPSNIPVHSWVHLLTSGLKNEIAYVKRIEGDSVYLLVVPWNLPYISGGENSAAHWELFDVDLACQHGLEVILTPSPEGRTIAHCFQSQYHCGLLHRRFQRHNIELVSLPTPEQIAWFVVLDVDPTLVAHTLTRFSAQKWQVGDCGKIQAGEFVNEVAYIAMDVQGESVIVRLDNPTPELPTSLEISIHNFKHKFRSDDSVDIIASPHRGFEGMVLSVDMIEDMALLCGNSGQQASQDGGPYDLPSITQIEEHFIEPGDAVCIISRPYRGLTGRVQYFSCSLRQIWVMWHIEKAFDDEDAKGDKGKSKAQVPEVPGKDSDSDGADDEEVIIVSLDDVQVTARPTLQFSKEKGWDVSKGDLIQVIWGPAVDVKGVVCSVDLITATLTLESEDGPWHNIPINFCTKLRDYSLCDAERHIGCEVWIISGPNKGYIASRFGILLDGTPLGPSRLAAFNHMRQRCFITQSQCRSTTPPPLPSENPSADPGPSNPWVTTPDDVNLQRRSEQERQTIDYGCVSWLFDNNFCNFSKWHVCLRVRLAYNHGTLGKWVVRTTIPDHFFLEKHGVAPPGHVSVTMTSSTVSTIIEHHTILACDLSPTNLTSTGQFCLILKGALQGEIHRINKCQTKKSPKGVVLEDGTQLPLHDVCLVVAA
ncbi:hypothetical protein M404DRAFT_31100 [Pisolithus tinctorius Marx 270]|uniref:KOW domain-containing protein n=1 Tax=Pisolithus tinctorius Marx 270 TaxID=870435 RepID=A0A0C3NU61_PISTI|nr:hypothetical protein M404DRAFT_31100 [Pisolithus tinctorius Marx 270]